MGLDLRLIASLDAIAIDNVGNKIELVVENSFECLGMSSACNEEVLNSNNQIKEYIDAVTAHHLGYEYLDNHIKEFKKWVEKYKNWNLKFQDI